MSHSSKSCLAPYWTTKQSLVNLLVQFGCVGHQTPKSKVNGPRVHFPYRVQTLKWKFGRERDKHIQVISSNHNNKHTGHKDLSRGSATPLRSSYVLVVEVTTKVGVSFTSLPLSEQPERSLELSTKKSRVIQTFQGSSTRWKLLGNA